MTGQLFIAFVALGQLAGCQVPARATSSWLDDPGRPAARADGRGLVRFACQLALALAEPRARIRLAEALRDRTSVRLRLASDFGDAPIAAGFPLAGHRRLFLLAPTHRLLIALPTGAEPLAFDLRGGIHRLDPTHPTQTPVLTLGARAESGESGPVLEVPASPTAREERRHVPGRAPSPAIPSSCQESFP